MTSSEHEAYRVLVSTQPAEPAIDAGTVAQASGSAAGRAPEQPPLQQQAKRHCARRSSGTAGGRGSTAGTAPSAKGGVAAVNAPPVGRANGVSAARPLGALPDARAPRGMRMQLPRRRREPHTTRVNQQVPGNQPGRPCTIMLLGLFCLRVF